MNAASLLPDVGYSAVDTAIAGANANSGGGQSDSAAESGTQFGDILAGVTANSPTQSRSDDEASWRSSPTAAASSLDQTGDDADLRTPDGATASGRSSPGPTSKRGVAANGDDSDSAKPGHTGDDASNPLPSRSSSSAKVRSAALANTSAQSQAVAGSDTLALLQHIVGGRFPASADQDAFVPPSSSKSDSTDESNASSSPGRSQTVEQAAAVSTIALFQKIIGVQSAHADGSSKPAQATAAADSDSRSTVTTQHGHGEASDSKRPADAAAPADSTPLPTAVAPYANFAASALGTPTLSGPAFARKTVSESADRQTVAGGSDVNAGTIVPQRAQEGATDASQAAVLAAMTQLGAKVTGQETHLPPTLPLSPMHQIFNSVTAAVSTLAASSPASAENPTLPVAGALTRTMTLALEPDELGKVEINMSLSNGQLNVAIGVDRSTTLQRLRDDQDELVTSLGSSGYDVHSVTIQGAKGDLSSFSSQSQTTGGQGSTQQSAT